MSNNNLTQAWQLDPLVLDDQIHAFMREDIGYFDLTATLLIDADLSGRFQMRAREAMTLAGLAAAARVFGYYDPSIKVKALAKDGEQVEKGAILLQIEGPARSILTAERTALNLVQHLSGIATVTATYVDRIEGTTAQLIDSRKTTPGLRAMEKHAVACGGGRNHRLGLDNGIMLKDNHIAICGSITAAVKRAKASVPVLTKVEVECDRLDQVEEALEASADVIMLDNMSVSDMKKAVEIVNHRTLLEASGGVRLETIREIAETGVDFISVGRITQSSPSLDIGLDDCMEL